MCGVGGSGETERDREIENASLMPEVTPWNVFLYGKIYIHGERYIHTCI